MDKASKKNPTNEEEYEEEEEEQVEEDENQIDNDNDDDMDGEEYVEEEEDEDVFDFDEIEEDVKPSTSVDDKPQEVVLNETAQVSLKKDSIVKEELSNEELSESRHITDAEAKENLQKLLKVDLESTSKEDIVNLLMKTELKATNIEADKKRKPKTRYNVGSHYNLEKLQSETLNKYRANINELKEHPELTIDFNTATKKLKKKMMQEPDIKQQKVYKILFSDVEKDKSDVERLSSVKTDYIGRKVKDYLSQKQRKIEDITEMLNEEMKQKCTFNPEIINNAPDSENNKRSLEQFIFDQNKHLEKVERKVEEFRDKKEKDELQIKEAARPKIDSKSQRIFEEKFKTDDKIYERLYKQRFGAGKNDLMENSGKTAKVRSSTENKFPHETKNKHVDKIEEYLIQKEKEKKPISKKEADEHVKKLYESANEKKGKLEKLKEKVINEELKGIGMVTASYESNKFVLKNVMKKYKEQINTIFSNLINSTGTNTLDFTSNTNHMEDPILNQIQLNRISLIQMNQLLQQLGYISNDNHNQKNNSNEDISHDNQNQPESSLKLEEKKLVCEMWEALKDSDGYVNVDHLFIFILAVVNLYEYYLYSSYKKANDVSVKSDTGVENEKKDKIEKDKYDPNKKKQEILAKISNDINSKIVSQGKYSAYDSDKNFLISFEKAKLVKKDFNLFYINFMNSNSIVKKKAPVKVNLNQAFKPSINHNSEKLSSEYRKKLARV